jgi:signal peptidase II
MKIINLSAFKLGLLALSLALMIDQSNKYHLIHIFGLADKGVVPLMPNLDLVMVWNKGISYGLFQQVGWGRWFLAGFKIIAGLGLIYYLTTLSQRFEALCIGLIAGGAFGNGIDGLYYGAVADFYAFKIESLNFHWYVFNLADVFIVCGVLGLLYLSFTQPKETS